MKSLFFALTIMASVAVIAAAADITDIDQGDSGLGLPFFVQAPPLTELEPILAGLRADAFLEKAGRGRLMLLSPAEAEQLSARGALVTRFFGSLAEAGELAASMNERKGVEAPVEEPGYDAYSDFLNAVVEYVTDAKCEAMVQELQDFQTRYSYTSECRDAEAYSVDKMRRLGLDAEFFEYRYDGRDWRNAVGTQVGNVYPNRVYVLCGHLDSITYTDPYNWAPGADDNGSGSGSVLLAAEILSKCEFDCTIKYIVFTGEEQGLWGSYYWVRDAYYDGLDIRGALNLDMTAYKDTNARDIDVYTDNQSQSKAMADRMIANASLYTNVTGYKIIDPDMWGSDHYYFWYYGYPAIFGIERATNHWNPYYHSDYDIVANCDFDLMTGTAQAAMATIMELAVPDTSNELNVHAAPEETSIPGGGTLSYAGSLINYHGTPLTVEVWAEATLPNGQPYAGNPVLGPVTVPLSGYGMLLDHPVSHGIPASAPTGTYDYEVKAGTYPGTVLDSALFSFTVY